VVSCWSLEWTIISPWSVYGGIIVPFCPCPCAKSSANLEHNCLDLVCSFINVAPKTTEVEQRFRWILPSSQFSFHLVLAHNFG
jgi:hypothetical protein